MWAAGKFPLAAVPASLEGLALEQSDDLCLRATFLAGLHRRSASEGGPPVRCSVTQEWMQSDRDVSWLQQQSPIITEFLMHLHCMTTAAMPGHVQLRILQGTLSCIFTLICHSKELYR